MGTTNETIATTSDPQGEREKSRRLAERYRCGFVDLFEQRIDPELFRSIPAELMFRFNFVPMEAQGGALVIAVADPSQVLLSDELPLLLGKKLIPNQRSVEAHRAVPASSGPGDRGLHAHGGRGR
jgi:hypothetical protein